MYPVIDYPTKYAIYQDKIEKMKWFAGKSFRAFKNQEISLQEMANQMGVDKRLANIQPIAYNKSIKS